MAKHPTVSVAASNTKKSILGVLESEGYIAGVEELEETANKKQFKIKFNSQIKTIFFNFFYFL